MSSSAASTEILSILRHLTANKQDKAAARLATIDRHVRDAEAAISSRSGVTDSSSLETDVRMLLTTVRKAFAGSLQVQVNGRGAVGGTSTTTYRGTRSGWEERTMRLEDRLDAIERMLWEAKYSSGFSNSATLAWRDELLSYLYQGQRRMVYTTLFGHLTNEWAEFRFGELSKAKLTPNQKALKASEDDKASPVIVGRKEMHEQREVWERHVTNERRTDTNRIVEFLDQLFHSGPQHEDPSGEEPTDLRAVLLRKIRSSISTACKREILVTKEVVTDAIRGVLSSDQLTSEKRRALLDISNKDNVLSEIADILSIDTHLDSIRRWSWGDNPITVQMRKAINGKYRVYLDLDLLDAILIQCIGQSISVNIRDALASAWHPDVCHVWQQGPDEARTAAMQAQIKDFTLRKTRDSVHDLRQSIYQRIFYTVGLPAHSGDADDAYDDSGSAGDEPKLTDLENGSPSKFSLRTDILRICSAEMAVQKLVHGQFCILQSDFEWFGPSLPHSTLIAIMKYFRFPSELVHLVEQFLRMRMKFEEDGKDGPVLTRKTGIPVSFQLTEGISELLLFTLDFAVNQRTGGSYLYRNHDDLWFWGQPEKCSVAWQTIRDFTDVMGLQLNKEKTASAHSVDEANPRYVPVDQAILNRLPAGKLKWGFLLFTPDEWKWVPNMPAIKEHMNELRFQLKSRTAVMAHVQAYNAYIQNFLPSSFGQVVTGLGDSHAITVLQALQYAQQCLYGGGDASSVEDAAESANVAQHVRKMIQARFGSLRKYDVPDCFLYMDVDSGGLGLANPVPEFAQFVHLAKDNEYTDDDDMAPMAKAMYSVKKELSDSYRADGKAFAEKVHAKRQKNRLGQRRRAAHLSASESSVDTDVAVDEAETAKSTETAQFMSFSEYVATSEEHSRAVRDLYTTMFDPPALEGDRARADSERWALAVFHTELEELFGGGIAEDEFLSLGLYRTLAEEKVRWDTEQPLL